MFKLGSLFIALLMIINMQAQTSFYSLKAETIDGKPLDFSTLKGKKVMIVNTASKCGYTPQYKELEEVFKKFGGDKFVIIGFPANDFLWQEPGSNSEIAEFCQKNYGVTFQMMSKITVKGNDIHPVYKWLTSKALNGKEDSEVKWNFQKYLINADGSLERVVPPGDKPNDASIISWIETK